MLARNMAMMELYLVFISLCSLFEMTNSRTSTMWKLNGKTGNIEKYDLLGERKNYYGPLDENMVYNFNAMAEVYSKDETFFTIVSSTRIDDYSGWLRQSVDHSLESWLRTKKINAKAANNASNEKSQSIPESLNAKNKIVLRNNSQNFDTLDCGQPVNYTNYDYIISIGTQSKRKRTPIMPEPEVISFFLHDQEDYKNFNVAALEKRLKYFRQQQPLSAEVFHHIGNYWRIIGEPVQAIKCFRRSLEITSSASEVMYDLAKVLHNLQYLDDAINMARRSIEFQTPPFSGWRQYLLLGDIMKTYGDLRGSVHYYRLALELNPTQELILKSLEDAEQKPAATLHTYTIIIICILVIMVLIAILISMITEVRTNFHHPNGYCASNSEIYDIKPQRHFNRAMAMRSLKGLSTTSRSMRQRKY